MRICSTACTRSHFLFIPLITLTYCEYSHSANNAKTALHLREMIGPHEPTCTILLLNKLKSQDTTDLFIAPCYKMRLMIGLRQRLPMVEPDDCPPRIDRTYHIITPRVANVIAGTGICPGMLTHIFKQPAIRLCITSCTGDEDQMLVHETKHIQCFKLAALMLSFSIGN